ncbi:MAG TPA: hypothetical protein VFI37_01100, partial [Gaiellaceae bacterium]|nr:hypothetical protein [Gaiellaceae bacterium]
AGAALERGDWAGAHASFEAALAEEETPEALLGLSEALWWLGGPKAPSATPSAPTQPSGGGRTSSRRRSRPLLGELRKASPTVPAPDLRRARDEWLRRLQAARQSERGHRLPDRDRRRPGLVRRP